jgi:hypothetical protein
VLRVLDSRGERIPESAMELSITEACSRARENLAKAMYAADPTVLDERGNVAWRETQPGDGLRQWIEYSDGVNQPIVYGGG